MIASNASKSADNVDHSSIKPAAPSSQPSSPTQEEPTVSIPIKKNQKDMYDFQESRSVKYRSNSSCE